MIRHFAFLAALPLLAACGADATAPPQTGPGETEPPAGDYVSDGLPGPYNEGDVLRVTFRENEISFQATCNTMSGRAEWVDDGVLEVSNLGGTEMGCPGAGFEQDEWLVDLFTSSPDLLVEGTDVGLAHDDAEIWLVPADEVDPDPAPDAGLDGTVWRLTGIEETDGDSVGMMGVRQRIGATLRVREGMLVAYTGCNSLGGDVMISDGWLRVKQPWTTLVGLPRGASRDRAVGRRRHPVTYASVVVGRGRPPTAHPRRHHVDLPGHAVVQW